MQELNKVLKKMLHDRCLAGFQIFLRFSINQGSNYARVTEGSERKAQL